MPWATSSRWKRGPTTYRELRRLGASDEDARFACQPPRGGEGRDVNRDLGCSLIHPVRLLPFHAAQSNVQTFISFKQLFSSAECPPATEKKPPLSPFGWPAFITFRP